MLILAKVVLLLTGAALQGIGLSRDRFINNATFFAGTMLAVFAALSLLGGLE